jgi:ABC-type lipoprotein export system ATPase subunit
VLIATHDPLLALSADRRIVIKNGGIHKVVETTPAERRLLEDIETLDNTVQRLRIRLRSGETITEL